MFRPRLIACTVALLALPACENDPPFSAEEWDVVESLSPLPDPPADPTNAFADDPAAALLGQRLFFEKSYSGALTIGNDGLNGSLGAVGDKGKVGCAGCHLPEAFIDTRSNPPNVSLGVKYTERNAPSLVNVAHYEWYGWGGKQDALWTQASLSPESGTNSAGNRCGYAHMVYDLYRNEYNSIFTEYPLPPELAAGHPEAARFPASCKPKSTPTAPDGPWELMLADDRVAVNRIMANSGKATAAYERLLVSRNAPFDRYVEGEEDAISPAAIRGLKVFIGTGFCVQCHNGPFFSDQEFHNLGIPQVGPHLALEDRGRFIDLGAAQTHTFNSGSVYSDDPAYGQAQLNGLVADDADLGAFRTATLRNVANTAPYFHTGSMATLADVVWFYFEGGGTSGFVGDKAVLMRRLDLTGEDRDDLVAFLESLTGEPIPEHLLRSPPILVP